MARTARTRLFAATLALTGCGDDGTTTVSSTSTSDPASTSSVGSTSNDSDEPTTTDATTSGGTMAVSGTTSGTSTGEPATSSTSSTSDDTTGSTSSTSGDDTTTSTSTTVESTSSESSSESSSEESSGGPPVNLFKNPSLETWTMAEVPNTTPDEWTNCSTDGIAVDAVPDSCMADPVAGTDGLRYARHFPGEGFAQTIPTIPGHMYALSFDYTAVEDCFGGPPSSAFEVLVDGVLLKNTPGGMIPMWNSADMQFMATSNTADICFRKLIDGGQGGLDNLAAYDEG